MSGKVCVFGAFNVDVVARLSRFPRPGESLIANGSLMGAGGKGANQAVAAARLGAEVTMVACIGEDAYGQMILDNLRVMCLLMQL